MRPPGRGSRRRPEAAASGDAMRRRPGEAAARGDSSRGWRWLICCWVGSASASASAASASAPEEARRSATPDPVVIFFLFRSCSLTPFRLCVAGITIKKGNLRRKFGQERRMASAWKYAASKLKGKAALLLLTEGSPRVLVPVKEYCLGMPVLNKFIVPGALPQVQQNGNTVLEERALLSQPAQELIRAVLLFLEELFAAGYFLEKIDDKTLLIDISTSTVLMSAEAMDQNAKPIESNLNVVDNTIASVATKLDEWVFTQNNYYVAEVPEVKDGLFKLMAVDGNNNWYAIINNMALVPIENRREAYMRLYEQLHNVVQKEDKVDYQDILEELEFPLNWHDAVSPELNGVLLMLYGGAIYNAMAVTRKEQAEQITRLFRNTGAHVLEKLWKAVGRSDVTLVQYAVAPRLAVSLQAALQKRNWLASTEVHTLIVYSRQSYT